MIEVRELRIGNYLKSIDGKLICTTVKGFYGFPKNTGIINHNVVPNDFEYLEPITLTEEWLLRFGFEIFKLNNGAYEVNLNDFFTLRFIPKDKWRVKDAFYVDSNDDDIGIIIEYVHSLQNYVFALTGQELELK